MLRFGVPLNVTCPVDPVTRVHHGAPCGGFSEPVMEFARNGIVWFSATTTIGATPPLWRSNDGGATFRFVPSEGTLALRQVFGPGIEGDLAIDGAGNAYFFDTDLYSGDVTAFDRDGKHRWTKNHPFLAPVDRPWLRAGRDGELFLLYFTKHSQLVGEPNGEYDSLLYASKDGGLTWSPAPQRFPCAVTNLAIDRPHDRLFLSGCGNYYIPSTRAPTLWVSDDLGAQWRAEEIPLPPTVGPRKIHPFIVPTVDEAGNTYVAFVHIVGEAEAVHVARRGLNGTWSGPWQVGEAGQVRVPWAAAGADGTVGIAWYQRGPGSADKTQWYLMSALSLDAASSTPQFVVARADSHPVAEGNSERRLGDFLTAEITPDGRFAIAYAQARPQDGALPRFVRSEPVAGIAPSVYPNGP